MEWLRREPLWLYLLAGMPAVAGVLNLYFGDEQAFKGHSPPVLLALASCVAATFSWLVYGSKWNLSRVGLAALVAVGVLWIYQLTLMRLTGTSVNLSALATGLLVALILLKPPSTVQFTRALQVFAVAVVVASLVTLALEPVSGLRSGFGTEYGFVRLGFLMELGWYGRWAGPFIHSSLAGQLGGAIVLIGLLSSRKLRVFLVVGGGIMLMMSQSRTGAFALVLTLAIWGAMQLTRHSKISSPAAFLVPLVAVGGITAYVVNRSPTLSGRTSAWIDYLGLMVSAPLFGVGDQGVQDYLQENSARKMDFAQPHAHNFLLDLGGRWGVLMLLGSMAVLGAGLWLGILAAKRGNTYGLLLMIFLLLVGITERPFDWAYPSPLLMLFILTIGVTAAATGRTRTSLTKDLEAPTSS